MSAASPQAGYPSGSSLPIGAVDAVGLRLTPGGTPILDTFVQQAVDSGLFWRLEVADGGGARWVFVAAPSCTDIDNAFSACAQLDDAVGTCGALDTWGYA